jgi:hypothetical protein
MGAPAGDGQEIEKQEKQERRVDGRKGMPELVECGIELRRRDLGRSESR